MSWIDAVSSVLAPVFEREQTPVYVAPKTPARKKSGTSGKRSAKPPTQVKGSVGVSVKSSRKGAPSATATGGVKVRSGPLTSSVSVKVDDKGRVSGRLGQGVEFSVGGHKLKLGTSVGTAGDLKSQVSWNSPTLKLHK